jgi:S1-C subfamily serine protease
MRRLIWASLLLAVVPLWGLPQSPNESWENLKQLRREQKIRLVDASFIEMNGRFLAVSEDAISLRVGGKHVSIARPEVRMVSISKSIEPGNVLLAVLFGALAGASASSDSDDDCWPEHGERESQRPSATESAIGAGVGAAAFGLAAALSSPSDEPIYFHNPTVGYFEAPMDTSLLPQEAARPEGGDGYASMDTDDSKEPTDADSEVKDTPTASDEVLPQPAGTETALSGEEIVDRASPSIVLILVGEGGGQFSGVGSGLIIRPEGIILTAYHLVKNAREAQVRLKNGETFDKVEIIAVDERRDVASLRIPAHGLPALSVASADEAKPGETVFVISNPGALSWTASSGVLSALRLADEVPGAGSGFRLLQFTAPVSPGSSGGALIDAQGRLLGIVVGSRQGQNLNFAVPIESVLGLADAPTRAAVGGGSGLRLPQGERTPTPARAPSPAANAASVAKDAPAEILRSARRVYVAGTGAFPPEPLEKKLFEEPEFGAGEFVIVENSEGADLVIELDRKAWTWDFTYRLTDPNTGVILGSGKVIAWDGVRAAPGIAKQILQRLRELRGTSPADTKKRRK